MGEPEIVTRVAVLEEFRRGHETLDERVHENVLALGAAVSDIDKKVDALDARLHRVVRWVLWLAMGGSAVGGSIKEIAQFILGA